MCHKGLILYDKTREPMKNRQKGVMPEPEGRREGS